MSLLRFVPVVEPLEGRLLLAVLATASEVDSHPEHAEIAPTASSINTAAEGGPITCYTECIDSDWELVVQLPASNSSRVVGVTGGASAVVEQDGIARLPLSTDSRFLIITVTDASGRPIPIIEVELGSSNEVVDVYRMDNKASGEGADAGLPEFSHSNEASHEMFGQFPTLPSSESSHAEMGTEASASTGGTLTSVSDHHGTMAISASPMARHELMAFRPGSNQNDTAHDSMGDEEPEATESLEESHSSTAMADHPAMEETIPAEDLNLAQYDLLFMDSSDETATFEARSEANHLKAARLLSDDLLVLAAQEVVTNPLVACAADQVLANLNSDEHSDPTATSWIEISAAIAISLASTIGAGYFEHRARLLAKHDLENLAAQ